MPKFSPQHYGDEYDDDVMVRIPDPPPPPCASQPPPSSTLLPSRIKDSYTVNLSYRPTGSAGGGSGQVLARDVASSSHSSSLNGTGSGSACRELVERKTQQRTTQQVTKVTKVYTTRRFEAAAQAPAPGCLEIVGSRDRHDQYGYDAPNKYTANSDPERQFEHPVDVSTTMLTGPPQTIEEKIITEMYDPTFGSPRHEEITYRYSPMPPPLADLPFTSYPPGIGTLHISSTSYPDNFDGERSSGFSSSHTPRPFEGPLIHIPSPYAHHVSSAFVDHRPNYRQLAVQQQQQPTAAPSSSSYLLTNPDDEDYPISESGAGTLEPLRRCNVADEVEETDDGTNYYDAAHFRKILNYQNYDRSGNDANSSNRHLIDRDRVRADVDRDEELAMLLRAEAESGFRARHRDDSNRSSAILLRDGKNGYRECGTDDEIPHHNSCDYQDSPRMFPNFPRSLKNNVSNGRHMVLPNGNGAYDPRLYRDAVLGQDDDLDEDGGIMVREVPDREICNQYYPRTNMAVGKGTWRDPDIAEVVEYLGSPDNTIKANAAAYLQHICYHDDRMKNMAGKLGAIPILIQMLNSHIPEVQRNACGALRNMAYGRANEENKKLILDSYGIPALISIFKNSPDENLKEVISGLLWNMSSYEDIKRPILENCLQTFNDTVILPQNQLLEKERGDLRPVSWSTVFRNVVGVIRNCSSDGVYARKLLREMPNFISAVICIASSALSRSDCDNKSIENCVCTLRNLSYRLQETVDPDYDSEESRKTNQFHSNGGTMEGRRQTIKQRSFKSDTPSGSNTPASSTSTSTSDYSTSSSNLKTPQDEGVNSHRPHIGCFGTATSTLGTSTRSSQNKEGKESISANRKKASTGTPNDKTKCRDPSPDKIQSCLSFSVLWDPMVVAKLYLGILKESANPVTLEAAAGALQNLAACYWQPSIDIRTMVRKEKGLPILVELIKLDNDKVVCAVVTALRNLSMDVRNKELIGKYAMRELVSKLPNPPDNKILYRNSYASDETVAAVLAVLHQVILDNPEYAQSLMEAHGIEKLVHISQSHSKESIATKNPNNKSARYANQVLSTMWKHKELRDIYIRAGWKESAFEQPIVQKITLEQNGIYKSTDSQSNSAVKNRNITNNGSKENSTLMRPISSQGPSVTPDRTPMPNQRIPQSQATCNNKINGKDDKSTYNQNLYHNNMNGNKPPTGYTYEPIYTQVNKRPTQNYTSNHRDVIIPLEKMEIRSDGKSRYDQSASDSWV